MRHRECYKEPKKKKLHRRKFQDGRERVREKKLFSWEKSKKKTRKKSEHTHKHSDENRKNEIQSKVFCFGLLFCSFVELILFVLVSIFLKKLYVCFLFLRFGFFSVIFFFWSMMMILVKRYIKCTFFFRIQSKMNVKNKKTTKRFFSTNSVHKHITIRYYYQSSLFFFFENFEYKDILLVHKKKTKKKSYVYVFVYTMQIEHKQNTTDSHYSTDFHQKNCVEAYIHTTYSNEWIEFGWKSKPVILTIRTIIHGGSKQTEVDCMHLALCFLLLFCFSVCFFLCYVFFMLSRSVCVYVCFGWCCCWYFVYQKVYFA